MTAATPVPVLVVSDGTGETAEKMVRAGLRQFEGRHLVVVQVISKITSPEALQKVFKDGLRRQAMIVTTLVDADMRAYANRLAGELQVPYVDLIDDLLNTLSNKLSLEPVGVPGLLRKTDERYFRRIEAVEFTVKADDGKEPRMLLQADIVLLGVSRTSKTPLSTFLAHKGYKVSNVPVVLDRPLPDILFEVNPDRVFALTIQPSALQEIRRARLKAMGMKHTVNYDDIDYILAELEYASDLYRGHAQWPVIDVTSRALEETATVIMAHMAKRNLLHEEGEAGQLR